MKKFIILAAVLLFISCKQGTPDSTSAPIKAAVDYTSIGTLLDSIHVEDQKYRGEIQKINEEFGWESDEMKNHWAKINAIDSNNLVIVEQILADHGWLSSEQIGGTANSTLFLVIQHSGQETQEKYLPMMRLAVKEGKARANSLALLEDRILLGKGELQIYGSQIGTDRNTQEMYVRPLVDPDGVNERRAEVGLGTIEEYVANWDLKWDVEDYKKKLPKWVEELQSSSN